MKTAMHQLLKWVKIMKPVDVTFYVEKKAISLLGDEKKQIIDAYNKGAEDIKKSVVDDKFISGEKYYDTLKD